MQSSRRRPTLPAHRHSLPYAHKHTHAHTRTHTHTHTHTHSPPECKHAQSACGTNARISTVDASIRVRFVVRHAGRLSLPQEEHDGKSRRAAALGYWNRSVGAHRCANVHERTHMHVRMRARKSHAYTLLVHVRTCTQAPPLAFSGSSSTRQSSPAHRAQRSAVQWQGRAGQRRQRSAAQCGAGQGNAVRGIA
jgi:hypothetical protein